MKFEWDEKKNETNKNKHFISFEEAAAIFKGIVYTEASKKEHFKEIREVSLGEIIIDEMLVIAVVHTRRSHKTRIISARRANKKERRKYYDFVRQRET